MMKRPVRLIAIFCLLGISHASAAEVPNMPQVMPVPDSGNLPLSSAFRPGTEYSDLMSAGYVEEEFYLYGSAPAIDADGRTILDAPYTTRILVRRPAKQADFNGTVIMEPFSWFGERGAGWILTRDYLLRRGYAYVGYTININGLKDDPKFPPISSPSTDADPFALYRDIVNFDFMRSFDYARYAPLGSYYDPRRFLRGDAPDPFPPQSQAIGAQLALLLKSTHSQNPMAQNPMGGMAVERIYVNSWAVTAQVWMDYLDQGRHQEWRMPDGGPLIDAYMTGKMAFGEVGGDIVRLPRKLPPDVPFVTIYSQSEAMYDAMNGIEMPADSDSPMVRFFEVAGMPHLRMADLGTNHRELFASDTGKGDDPNCVTLYDEPSEVVAAALLDAMDQWVRLGTPMPKAPRMVRNGSGLARDLDFNNLIGGVRPPWIMAPTASYLTEQETQCGLIYDTKVNYTPHQLRKAYGTYDNYVVQFELAKEQNVRDRFLLSDDKKRVQPIAKRSDFD